MATVDYTTDRLIESIERRAGFPARQGLYEDADFISFLNEAMYQNIVPRIMSVREEYFLDETVQNVVANQKRYAIPDNAIGQKIRNAELVDETTPGQDDQFYSMRIVDREVIGSQQYYQYASSYSGVYVYYLEANDIVIFPTPRSDLVPIQLRIVYYRRPNELVEVIDGGTITGIDTGTGVISFNSVPGAWNTNTVIDFVKGRQPFNMVVTGEPILNVSGSDLTISTTSAALLTIGDGVAEEGFTIIPNLPFEAHRLLEQAGVIRLLEGADDSDGLSRAYSLYDQQLKDFLLTITPRSDGGRKKIVPRNDLLHHARSTTGY